VVRRRGQWRSAVLVGAVGAGVRVGRGRSVGRLHLSNFRVHLTAGVGCTGDTGRWRSPAAGDAGRYAG
jgi:hypothetical protein